MSVEVSVSNLALNMDDLFNRKPRVYMKILRALTPEFQPLNVIAFKSGDVLGSVSNFLEDLVKEKNVEKQVARRTKMFRWTLKGLRYFEIQKMQYSNQWRKTHQQHRTNGNEGHSCSS